MAGVEPGKLNMKTKIFQLPIILHQGQQGSRWVQQGKKILVDLGDEGHRMAGKLVSDKF